MRIDRYISATRIIDLSSQDLRKAYSELLGSFKNLLPSPSSRKKVLGELISREQAITSYLGEGVALPHARVKMNRPFALAIGRCPTGLTLEGQGSYDEIRYVFLLLASENACKLSLISGHSCPYISGQISHGSSLDGPRSF